MGAGMHDTVKIPLPSLRKFPGRRLAGRISELTALAARLVPSRTMLALEVGGEQLRAALVSGRAGQFTVLEFVAVERANPGDDLPDPQNIREIMERLDYQSGPAVLVTPLVRAVQISMNRAMAERLSNYQLAEAARWEIEPFTGISGSQAMVGVEKAAPAGGDDLLAAMAGEEADIEVNVSAIEQNVFRALKQLLKKAGLGLARLYPPDVCFYMALRATPELGEASRAVLDLGADYANFTLLKSGKPRQINTYPVGREVLRDLLAGEELPEALDNLRFLLKQVPGPLPLVLTGSGATDHEVVEFVSRECAYGAAPLVLPRQAKLTEAGHERLNSVYAGVAGAAVRELMGQDGRAIGITDVVPLGPRLRKSAYLMPLAVTVLLALSLFGHYGYMKVQKERYKVQAKELAARVKEKKSGHDAYEQAKKEEERLGREIRLTRRKIDFVRGGSDDNLKRLAWVLASLAALPDEMTLGGLEEKGGVFVLSGSSNSLEALGGYANALQKLDWCRAAELKNIESGGDGRLSFTIELATTKEEMP